MRVNAAFSIDRAVFVVWSMAAVGRLDEQQTQSLLELLTCPSCFQLLREPVQLDCGHTFCAEPCASAFYELLEPKQLHCPVCHKVAKAESRSKLLPARQLGRIAERLRAAEGIQLECQRGGPNCTANATVECADCGQAFLCAACSDEVHVGAWQWHSFGSLFEQPRPDSRKCQRHPRCSLEVYCLNDHSMICVYCLHVGEHVGHFGIPLAELEAEINKRMESSAVLLRQSNEQLKTAIEAVDRRLQAIDKVGRFSALAGCG